MWARAVLDEFIMKRRRFKTVIVATKIYDWTKKNRKKRVLHETNGAKKRGPNPVKKKGRKSASSNP